jgi:hypothetical protein
MEFICHVVFVILSFKIQYPGQSVGSLFILHITNPVRKTDGCLVPKRKHSAEIKVILQIWVKE